jgi:hypothetical protein
MTAGERKRSESNTNSECAMKKTISRTDPTTLPRIVAKAVAMAIMGETEQASTSDPVIRRFRLLEWEAEFTGGAASRIVLKFNGAAVLKVRLAPGWQKNAACIYTEEIATIPQGWRADFAALEILARNDNRS